MNMISWLAGEEEQISIRPKPTDIRPLNMTGDLKITFFWLYAVLFPFVVIMIGVIIWFRRRSR